MKIYKNVPRSEVQNILFYKIRNDQIRKEKSVSMVKWHSIDQKDKYIY